MATISIAAEQHLPGGPSIIPKWHIYYTETPQPTSTCEWIMKEVVICFGQDQVRIWPADPQRIREAGEDLIKLADKLAAK